MGKVHIQAGCSQWYIIMLPNGKVGAGKMTFQLSDFNLST